MHLPIECHTNDQYMDPIQIRDLPESYLSRSLSSDFYIGDLLTCFASGSINVAEVVSALRSKLGSNGRTQPPSTSIQSGKRKEPQLATGRNRQRTKQVGEYLVASELCRRDLIATTFTGNVPNYDIVADDGKIVLIQV